MYRVFGRRKPLLMVLVLLLCAVCFSFLMAGGTAAANAAAKTEKKFIKYVEFNVTYEALDRALSLDVKGHEAGKPVSWVELLSLAAARNGGNFKGLSLSFLDETANKLQDGTTIEELSKGLDYYSYYREAYGAILDGLVGEYEEEVPDEAAPGGKRWQTKYGLKGYSPVAKGYYYSEFDDFGTSRTYGYKRQHLGHDMMGQIGTPIVAVESGTVEALGWNQYGGWRIGIRSLDKKRYYYYAHLRQNLPFATGLEEGSTVTAGDVIGYLGHTGYSTKENVNNITEPHLHFGLELIFDESQKESDNEIWVNVYPLVRLLSRHQTQTAKVEGTKDHARVYGYRDALTAPAGE